MPAPKVVPPPAIPFTPAAYEQMQQEVAHLTQQRKEVLVRLQAAREMGDLSENGAYTYAKMELGNISRRLRQLHQLIRDGYVATKPTSTTTVQFGSTVTLLRGKQEIIYTLVSIHESNLTERKISTDSPLGAAIMGKQVGDQVEVTAPAGTMTYQIINIS